MISIDMKVASSLVERDPDGVGVKMTLHGLEQNKDAEISAALRASTAQRVRIIVLEPGEEFPEMPRTRPPHTGEGTDPFA